MTQLPPGTYTLPGQYLELNEDGSVRITPEGRQFLLTAYQSQEPINQKILGLLLDAWSRMDRARGWLTNDNPRPECNWGVLDTTVDREKLGSSYNESERIQELATVLQEVMNHAASRRDGWEQVAIILNEKYYFTPREKP